MRAVVQRVSRASVKVSDEIVGKIGPGMCGCVAVGDDDTIDDARSLANKVVGLRIFSDADDKMNLSLLEVGGQLLAVSQFTLHGDVRKGKRPSFVKAMAPEPAKELFEIFVSACREEGAFVETGRFRASMEVEIIGDGPVTVLVDTKRTF